MDRTINIPIPKKDSIGGPSTFMRNLLRYLEEVGYPIQEEIYHSFGIFFPVQISTELLTHYKYMGGAIIQRLDGVYYPSQHGEDFEKRNSQIAKLYVDYSTHVIFQSEYSRMQCFEMLGSKNDDEYSIILNGVNRKIFYPNDKNDISDDGIIKFITVGNFRKKAMILPIVESLDMLSEKYRFQLTLVGDVLDPELKKYLDRDYILHVGPRDMFGVSELLRDSDIFLHSQLNDNCPNTVMEAISCGLPVVGFNSGSMSEICSFSKDLLADIPFKLFHIFEDLQSEALVEKIDLCVKEYSIRRKKALEKVALYDFNSCGDKYVQVFDNELNKRTIDIPWSYLIKGHQRKILRKMRSSVKEALNMN